MAVWKGSFEAQKLRELSEAFDGRDWVHWQGCLGPHNTSEELVACHGRSPQLVSFAVHCLAVVPSVPSGHEVLSPTVRQHFVVPGSWHLQHVPRPGLHFPKLCTM